MIPHRQQGKTQNRLVQEDDCTSIPDNVQELVSSGMATRDVRIGIGLDFPNLRAAANHDMESSALEQQVRLFQANQGLLSVAHQDRGQGMASILQNSNSCLSLRSNVPPQVFPGMNQFAALNRIELKPSVGPVSFPSGSMLSRAYQQGKDEIMRAFLQRRNIEAVSALHHLSIMPMESLNNTPATTHATLTQQRLTPSHSHGLSLNASLNQADKNSQVLEELGTMSIERRIRNAPYFDASLLNDPDPVSVSIRRSRGGVTEPFPEKLHRMLSEVEKNGQDDIICFRCHGRAFAIHDPTKFCKDVMPIYFKQSRLSSFQRQLNLYGFTRVTKGPDAGSYYHELFLKGRPALAIHMRRVGITSATNNQRSVRPIGNAPDFYSMSGVRGASSPKNTPARSA